MSFDQSLCPPGTQVNPMDEPRETPPMTSPTFDSDGYPTDETLDAIRAWPHERIPELFAFIKEAWEYPNYFRVLPDGQLKISTGGWSGNESLIDALHENRVVWAICWQSSKRGGHYEFEIPEFMRAAAKALEQTP